MIPHRVRQLLTAGARPGPGEINLARQWLDGALLDLFLAQHPRDIVHSVNTARWLIARGHRDHDLIRAALLHDIGKGEQRRGDRALWVILSSVGAGQRAASAESRFAVRNALARTRDHSQSGAAILGKEGASARVVHLTLAHHSRAGDDPVLALLQAADAAN